MEEINNVTLDPTLLAAFLGGFVSYLFTRIKDFSDNYIKIKQSNINGLVIAERNLIANLMIVSRNKAILDQYIKSISSNELIIPFFHPYIVQRNITDHIRNISLVNMHANCVNGIDHLNSTFQQISSQYNEIKNAVHRGAEKSENSFETFNKLLSILSEKTLFSFKQLADIQNNLEKELLENIAANQISYDIAMKSSKKWIIMNSYEQKLPSNMENLIKEKVCSLEKEIQEQEPIKWDR